MPPRSYASPLPYPAMMAILVLYLATLSIAILRLKSWWLLALVFARRLVYEGGRNFFLFATWG
jgi:hypothetical protein